MQYSATLNGCRNDNISITICHKDTFYNIEASDDNEFIFYDNFKVNVDETSKYAGDDYAYEVLASELFAQPDYAFIIDNRTIQISSIKNVGEMMLQYAVRSRSINEINSWIRCKDEYSKDLCETIKLNLTGNDGEHPVEISKKEVVYKPYGSWVTYDCTKTVYRGGEF